MTIRVYANAAGVEYVKAEDVVRSPEWRAALLGAREYRRRHGLTKGTAMKPMDLESADFDHSIEEGDPVTCRTAHGTYVNRVAITRVQAGRDFPVVRVSADEFGLDDGGTDGIPWPAEDVRRGWIADALNAGGREANE